MASIPARASNAENGTLYVTLSWHNHLNPSVNKDAWSDAEDKLMFEAHQIHGNRWTEIAKMFEGRTDNDIKNHFYSMLRRSLRRVNKLLGMRNSTRKVRLIKPSVLSKIFVNIGMGDEQKSEDCRRITVLSKELRRTCTLSARARLSTKGKEPSGSRNEKGWKTSSVDLQSTSNSIAMQ